MKTSPAAILGVFFFAILLQGCANNFAGISTPLVPVAQMPPRTSAALIPKIPTGTTNKNQKQKIWWQSRQTLFVGPHPHLQNAAPFSFYRTSNGNAEIGVTLVQVASAKLSLRCDGSFSLKAPGFAQKFSAETIANLDLTSDDNGRTGAQIFLSNKVRTCQAKFAFPNSRRVVNLVYEAQNHPAPNGIYPPSKQCRLPVLEAGDELQNAFFAHPNLSQTCPFPIGNPDLLELEHEAFNAKAKALLGQNLPAAFLQNADPGAPIDVSKAPKLSLIYISTLDYKADFSGMVIARLLRHHAAHGTTIRIMTSKILERRKDWMILEKIASDYPNVALQFYNFSARNPLNIDDQIASLHRVHHVKLFIAISPSPNNSVAILGGRNIHDGFLYDTPADLSAYPALQQYGGKRALTLNYYSNWHDFDLAIHDVKTVKALAAHFSTVWFHDENSGSANQTLETKHDRKLGTSGLARHFISIPGEDAQALQTYYVNLLDAARLKIEIVNPYLNFTPAIAAAIDRALARGVKVEIIGRVDMRGDLGGELITAVNETFVQKNHDRITIYDYKAAHVVLHAKILLIDNRFVIVSSVNLNNRSFIHDSENGIAVLDSAFYQRMKGIFDYYKSDSIPVSKTHAWSPLRLLLLSKTLREAL